MGFFAQLSYQYMLKMLYSNIVCAILAIALAVIVYVGTLLLLGGFSEIELDKIPFVGQRLIKILKWMKVLRRKA